MKLIKDITAVMALQAQHHKMRTSRCTSGRFLIFPQKAVISAG
jgi:hypothetical protein